MHLCENCHQFVDDNSQYCANCGAPQKGVAPAREEPASRPPSEYPRPTALPQTLPPPYPTANRPFQQQEEQNPYPRSKGRNRWVSAGLNFFFPGAGYIYNGIGRDRTQLVFGVIVLVAFFVGFYVPIVGSALSVSSGTSVSSVPIPPIENLEILIFILPIGLAYDAYRRAG